MKNRFCLKRACVIISAAAVLAAGVPGLSTVTAWALPSTATVTSSSVNVRASAVDGEVIDALTLDEEVDVIDSVTGSDGMTWYQVSYTHYGTQIQGWVRSDLVNAVEDSEAGEADAEAAAQQAAEEEAARAAEEEAAQQAAADEAARQAEAAADEAVATSEGGITYVITSTIPASVIPDGYRKTNVNYEGNEIQALVMETADVYLLYMEDASGTAEGRFVIYDIDRAELIPYICFDTQDGFIVLLNIPDSELSGVSDRFSLTTCEFDTGTMDALQMVQKDSVISDSANLSDFYYMYGVTKDGTYGWYVYDRNTESLQENVLSMRYNLNGTTVEVVEEEEPAFSLDSLSMIVIVGVFVILLLLVVLVIIFGIRYRQLAKQYDALANGGGRKEGRKERREKKRAAKETKEEDDFYFDEEEGDDSVFVREEDDRPPVPEQRSRPRVSEATQNIDFEAERKRIMKEAPATEPLTDPQTPPAQPARTTSQQPSAQPAKPAAEPAQPVKPAAEPARPEKPAEPVQPAQPAAERRKPVQPAFVPDDDDDDLEFL